MANKIELLKEADLRTTGTYELNSSVGGYSGIEVIVGYDTWSAKALGLIDSHVQFSLIPDLKADTDQGYVCSSSTVYDSNFSAFNAFSNASSWISKNYTTIDQWVQIQKVEGTIRTNMFSVMHGSNPAYDYAYKNIRILGSNDGVNWDMLVNENLTHTPRSEIRTDVFYLDDYVEYSYLRLQGNSWNSYTACRAFLIQDSAIHNEYPVTESIILESTGDSTNPTYVLNHDDVGATIQGSSIVVDRLTVVPSAYRGADCRIIDIYGLNPPVPTYRTYKRDANGIPQLVLADITSIASGMNKTTFSDDLQSLVTMAKVDDLIAKMNTCTYAGRIDSEDDLPTTDVKIGTIYLVGPEGSDDHEEFIYTEQGTWERLGSVRSSDVDLSDYTTTEGMNSAISTATGTLSTNLDNMDISVSEKLTDMTTSVDAAIAATNTKVDASLGALTVEVELVGVAPTTWPDKMDDNGVVILVD